MEVKFDMYDFQMNTEDINKEINKNLRELKNAGYRILDVRIQRDASGFVCVTITYELDSDKIAEILEQPKIQIF